MRYPKQLQKYSLNDCIINWSRDHHDIHNLIRGLSPYPCARSFFIKDSETVQFKIFESQSESEDHSFKPGEIISDGKHYIKIACKTGFLNIVSIQIEGKKRMSTVEFLRGFKISDYKIGINQPAS